MTEQRDDGLFERVIQVKDIQAEKGSRIVVYDTAENQFSTNNVEDYKHLVERPHQYIGKVHRVKFGVAKGKFFDFYGFIDEDIEEDPETDALRADELVDPEQAMDVRDRQITRQSAAHDASRIVAAKIIAGCYNGEGFEQVNDEKAMEDAKKWTKFFKKHARTGEYP